MRVNIRYLAGLLSAVLLGAAAGCGLLFPRQVENVSRLVPVTGGAAGYSTREDGTVVYAIEGLRLEARYVSDQELNERFPQESAQGRYSVNPYTYGDYVDPSAGYVRNRFTVFQVTVYNLDFARVELQPLRSLLVTDRPGETFQAYGISAGSGAKDFQSYYRALKGASGNDEYRFDLRMGLVRTYNYGEGQPILKGGSYGGFIVFDPLAPEVRELRLRLRDFILQFNAYGKPLQTLDVEFRFARQLTVRSLAKRAEPVAGGNLSWAMLKSASQVQGNLSGDITRDASAVDALTRSRMDEIGQCFQREIAAGKAVPGEIEVQFAILPNGTVEDARALNSTVASDAVGACVTDRIKRWRFPSVGWGATQSLAADSLADPRPAVAVEKRGSFRVTVTSVLSFVDRRDR
jgi:hypothetical protein